MIDKDDEWDDSNLNNKMKFHSLLVKNANKEHLNSSHAGPITILSKTGPK